AISRPGGEGLPAPASRVPAHHGYPPRWSGAPPGLPAFAGFGREVPEPAGVRGIYRELLAAGDGSQPIDRPARRCARQREPGAGADPEGDPGCPQPVTRSIT